MKTMQTIGQSIEELAETAVRLGRELQQAAHDAYLGGSSREAGFVDRTLRRLAERDPFDARDEAGLHNLRGIIETDLQSEVTGTERRFFETHYDEQGQHGEVRDCPVYSARGEELLRVREMYAAFVVAREATLDRIAAERAVLRLLSA